MKLFNIWIACLVCLSAVAVSCDKEHSLPDFTNPLDPENGAVIPPTPSNLVAVPSDGMITLRWEISDTMNIKHCLVYRSDSTLNDFKLLDSVAYRTYTDSGLINGIEYFYQVSAVDTAGLEGYRSTVVSAIPVDNIAIIYSLTENTNGEVKLVGDTIHFTMVTRETGGQAMIRFLAIRFIVLNDIGIFGDAIAGDGTYEVNYVVQRGDEVTNARVIGYFTDKAGNEASPVTAPGLITVNEPPNSSEFRLPFTSGPDSIILYWEKNDNTDFLSYNIYKSMEPGITEIDSLFEVTIINQNTIEYTVQGLIPNTTYYFKLFVHDTRSLSTDNEEVRVTTSDSTGVVFR